MKFTRCVLVLAAAILAFAGVSNAQTISYLATGASALFLELGQAATTLGDTGCAWSQSSTPSVVVLDKRTKGGSTSEQGNVWIAWGPGSGSCASPSGSYDIYAEMSLDSVIGNRCYFEVDSTGIPGCEWSVTIAAGTAGSSLLSPYGTGGNNGTGAETPIPQAIITALNGAHTFVAAADTRPEDDLFATKRMFTACSSTLNREPYNQTVYETTGLGYETSTSNVGVPVLSSFSATTFHVLNYAITGKDPFTGKAVPAYTVSTVGAQPIVVTASPISANGLGSANDISTFTLALFYEGVVGRSSDVPGVTATNPVTVLVREPLSGTYNAFEYSVPNSSQFKTTQDANNCNSSGLVNTNPLNVGSANGAVAGASRKRVIGTGEMTKELQAATTDTLGYFFWSAANAKKFTTSNGKYLTVNGVDPLQNSYSGGLFPNGQTGMPPLSNVTFANLNSGDYPVWSALRLVSQSPTPAGVSDVISAAQTLTSTQSDFITLANLKVWHSHFGLKAINVTTAANGNGITAPNDLCPVSGALTEQGGDAGGANVLFQSNKDFCTDYSNVDGLVNKNN
jgi:hypothetical protein